MHLQRIGADLRRKKEREAGTVMQQVKPLLATPASYIRAVRLPAAPLMIPAPY